jgi:hypothetical protein
MKQPDFEKNTGTTYLSFSLFFFFYITGKISIF